MYITQDFLNYFCRNVPDDFAFDVHRIHFGDRVASPPSLAEFMEVMLREINLPENQEKKTIIHNAQFSAEAIEFDVRYVNYLDRYYLSPFLLNYYRGAVNSAGQISIPEFFSTVESAQEFAKDLIDSFLDLRQLCYVSPVSKQGDQWVHSLEAVDDVSHLYYVFNPVDGSNHYVEEAELESMLEKIKQQWCLFNNFYTIRQAIEDTVDHLVVRKVVVSGPY